MIVRSKVFFKKLDVYLPALLLACLLSWQNAVHAGAADWVSSPELVAADGQLLSASDFCNRVGSVGGDTHCIKCVSAGHVGLAGLMGLISLGVSFVSEPVLVVPQPFIDLYAGSSRYKRGPPNT